MTAYTNGLMDGFTCLALIEALILTVILLKQTKACANAMNGLHACVVSLAKSMKR